MGRLNAGSLRERIALLTPSASTPDGRGGFTQAGPDTEVSLWARVRQLSQNELQALGQITNPAAYEITIRRRSVSVGQRVRWENQPLNVTRVAPDEDKEFIKLTCFSGGKQ